MRMPAPERLLQKAGDDEADHQVADQEHEQQRMQPVVGALDQLPELRATPPSFVLQRTGAYSRHARERRLGHGEECGDGEEQQYDDDLCDVGPIEGETLGREHRHSEPSWASETRR